MSNATNTLQQLRDIHLPSPISWWPLAPGWYLLFLASALLMSYIAYVVYLRWRKTLVKKIALKQLIQLQNIYHPQASPEIISELSVLLKRVALAKFPRQRVAGLEGKAWLEFLYNTSNCREFTQEVGELLITAPYRKQLPDSATQLFPLVKQWIEING